MSDDVGALQGREALLTSCDGSIHQGTDLIECHTQTVRSRSDEALSDLSTLGADLRVVEDGLLDARDEVVFEEAVDGVSPALDAVTDDIGFAFLRQLAGGEERRELVYVSLLYGEAAAAATEQEPLDLAEDLKAVTVRVATVIRFR